jgi:hypothetical protein
LIPGPPDASEHEKLVATDWLRLNVCPSAGELMCADGRPIAGLMTVSTSDPHTLIDAALAESPEYEACQ